MLLPRISSAYFLLSLALSVESATIRRPLGSDSVDFAGTLLSGVSSILKNHNNKRSAPSYPDESAIQKALDTPTGNPSNCSAGTKFFPQPVDHATWDRKTYGGNHTYLQQFEAIDKFYKPGGPILFFQGNENAKISCLEFTMLPTYAEQLGALLVMAEHRYFGLSIPYGLNYTLKQTWPTELLKPLTLENVLQDSWNLMSWVKSTYKGAKESKVIVTGGSYGGFLATQHRIHNPELVYGAVASSAPTRGFQTDPKDPFMYHFGDWGNMIYNQVSLEASNKIQTAIRDLRKTLSSGKFDGLKEQLHLCYPPNKTSEADDLIYSVTTAYLLNAQDNGYAQSFPLYATINATLAANDSMAVIGAAVKTYNKWNNPTGLCLDWKTKDDVGGDPYTYIRCTYMPHPDGYTHANTIWGSNPPPLKYKHALDPKCQASFGIDCVTGGKDFIKKQKLDDKSLRGMTRLVMTHALMDPVHAYGPVPFDPPHNVNGSSYFSIAQASHADDLTFPLPGDSQSMNYTRAATLNAMKAWLGHTS